MRAKTPNQTGFSYITSIELRRRSLAAGRQSDQGVLGLEIDDWRLTIGSVAGGSPVRFEIGSVVGGSPIRSEIQSARAGSPLRSESGWSRRGGTRTGPAETVRMGRAKVSGIDRCVRSPPIS